MPTCGDVRKYFILEGWSVEAGAMDCLVGVVCEGIFQGNDNDLYFILCGGYTGMIQMSKSISSNI